MMLVDIDLDQQIWSGNVMGLKAFGMIDSVC